MGAQARLVRLAQCIVVRWCERFSAMLETLSSWLRPCCVCCESIAGDRSDRRFADAPAAVIYDEGDTSIPQLGAGELEIPSYTFAVAGAGPAPTTWTNSMYGSGNATYDFSLEPVCVPEMELVEVEERPEQEVECGARYKGQWKGNVWHGYGVLTKPDNSIYEGSFVDGRAQGEGSFVASTGNKYEGQWEQDRAHGYGMYQHEDGSTYHGEWYQDEKYGKGKESWADGSCYEGEFLRGIKHGVGIYKACSTGVIYEGQFRQDKMDGDGKYQFADGRMYEGQWQGGHTSGEGKMAWPDGSRYTGGYKKDMRHGEGSFTWPDGRVYTGQWKNGKQQGTGSMTNAQGVLLGESELHNGLQLAKDASA